jgi:hypothetical protein
MEGRMTPEITLTLLGHLSAWDVRMRADAPGALWVAWLRHAAHGLLGIYALPKPTVMRASLPEQTWVRIHGLLRPVQVIARTDADPRFERESAQTPLLLHAISVTVCDRAAPSPAPEIRSVQIRAGRWIGGGYLAPARHLADVTCFTPASPANRAILAWRRPYGVITRVGTHRYLRYVLTGGATAQEQSS